MASCRQSWVLRPPLTSEYRTAAGFKRKDFNRCPGKKCGNALADIGREEDTSTLYPVVGEAWRSLTPLATDNVIPTLKHGGYDERAFSSLQLTGSVY